MPVLQTLTVPNAVQYSLGLILTGTPTAVAAVQADHILLGGMGCALGNLVSP